jgi:hypothetical protein
MTVWLKSAIGSYCLIKTGEIEKVQQAATLEETIQM